MLPKPPITARHGLTLLLLTASLGSLLGCHYVAHNQNAAGVALFDQGNYPAAQQKFNQALAQDPNNGDSYYNLAAIYHRQARQSRRNEDYTQAEILYNQCLDHSANHVDCHRALAVLLAEQGRTDEAFRLLERWGTREPSLTSPKIELARLAQEFGRRDVARQQLLAAVAVNPYDARALAALGQIYEQDGDAQRALANYQRSLAANNFQPELANRVAMLRGYTPAPTLTAPNGTRTVGAPQPPVRY